jgi:hypothetical protein
VKTKRSILLEAASVAALFAAAGLLAGCDTDSDLENAAEEVDENIDDAADEVEDAVDDVADDIDDGID